MNIPDDGLDPEPRPSSAALLTVWVMGIVTGVFGALIAKQLRGVDEEPDVALYREVRDFAQASYVRELNKTEIVDLALDGLTRSLDEYSRYYDAEASAELDRDTAGRYAGLGALFQLIDGRRHVLFALSGGPAERAGLRVGDVVLEVDGITVAGLDEEAFQDLMRSTAGQRRALRLEGRDGIQRDVDLMPEELLDPSVRHFHMVDPTRGLAYLSIHSFSRQTSTEFDSAWRWLESQGARALVIDLRGNLGGVLDAAVDLARRFVADGPIVSTVGRFESEVQSAVPSEATMLGLPLVVLVDEHSASASEVLAGALQDHRAGVLVGAPTFGKGMVQTIRRFEPSGTSAKLTSAHYYSPSQRNFERTMDGRDYGIRPDIEVAMTDDQRLAARVYNARYGPPVEALADLEAWQQELDQQLIAELPDDPQMRTALLLLAGERPIPGAVYSPAGDE